MFRLLGICFGTLVRLFCSHQTLVLENLALRQQLFVLKPRHPRAALDVLDRLFGLFLRRFWSAWREALLVVTPNRGPLAPRRIPLVLEVNFESQETHRKNTNSERRVRDLICQMVAENPTWGAPRIHGELLMLGFDVSERTISRWMKRTQRKPDPAKRWLTFLRNHKEAIAAMDFFTVPTLTFGLPYCFFLISHDRRRILHFNVTKHPSTPWIVQQLREAFAGSVNGSHNL